MPRYEITAPNGKKYQIDAPEGATQDDAINYVKTNFGTAEQQKQIRMPLSTAERFVKGMKDPIDAGAQALTHMLPQGLVDAVDQANNFIADKTGLTTRLPAGGIDQALNQDEAQYQARRQAQGDTGFDGARLVGNIASPVNVAIAAKLPVAASAGNKLLTSALAGAGTNAATAPVYGVEDQGNFLESKLKQAGVGAVGGAVGQGLTNGLSRVISPQASKNAELALLRDEGVNPTIGQALGGRFNALEEKASSIPIFGDVISRARGNANSQLEKAAFNRTLKPVGLRLPDNLKGRDAVEYTEQILGKKYDDVLNKIGAIAPDNEFMQKATQLSSMVDSLNIPQASKDKFNYLMNEVQGSISPNGVITSEGYKMLESSLGSAAKKLGQSQDIYDDKIATAALQLQSSLKDMLERQAGPNAKELQKANAAWANFKRVQRASNSLGADGGSFTPAQLQNAVKALDKSKDKARFARGDALMQDLSEAGKNILGNKVPNSGTSDRALLASLGTAAAGGYFVNPAIPTAIGIGAAAYTNPAQKALVSLLASRPQSANKLSELLGENSNKVIPASSTTLLQLLNQE